MIAIRLKSGRERSIEKRHPWVFSGAIVEGCPAAEPKAGEVVEVKNAAGGRLGVGWYSPKSQIRVRMLGSDFEGVGARVERAVRARDGLFASGYTDAARLINAENDFLPGVVADYYAGWIVCQFTSAGGDANKREIAEALMGSVGGAKGVCERRDLKDREKEGLPMEPTFAMIVGEEPPEGIEIREGKCKFLVDVRKGHKTGFYLDQREARRLVGEKAAGREVLNCFCYTGGFGLFAAAEGAKRVTQVDISEDAIAMAKRNAELLGGIGDCEIAYEAADVFQYLRECRDAGRKFDMIVLDPPKFAAVKSQVMKAARGYKDINLLAMKLLRPGGLLATFSCSGAMTAELFDKVLAEAAEDAKRDFQVIARTRQAEDHPAALAFPEGFYLKGVVLKAVN